MRGVRGVGRARSPYRGTGDAVPPVGGQHHMIGVTGSVEPGPLWGGRGRRPPCGGTAPKLNLWAMLESEFLVGVGGGR